MKSFVRLCAGIILILPLLASAQQIGDTLHIGQTWVDQQHELTFERMFGLSESVFEERKAYMAWMWKLQPEYNGRVEYAVCDVTDGSVSAPYREDGPFYGPVSYGPSVVVSAINGPAINFNSDLGAGDPDDIHASIATLNPFSVVETFTHYDYPSGDTGTFSARSAGHQAGEGYTLHNVYYPTEDADPFEMDLYYHRGRMDGLTNIILNTTPGDDQRMLVTDKATNHSAAVAVSPNGNRITLAQTVSRYHTLGEGDPDNLFNNDIYLWEGIDAGATWSMGLQNAENVTNFIPINENMLPDTVAANQDTFRVYGDMDVIYDDNNILHLVFVAVEYHHFSVDQTPPRCRLYYWNDADEYFIMLADGSFALGADTPHLEATICNPNLHWDDSNDLLWCSWVQYGEADDYDGENDPIDASDDGYKASDIYVSATEDLRHWGFGVNITNTRNDGTQLAPYETESEREMSLSKRSDDDHLFLFYEVDYDPGISNTAGALYDSPASPEGEPTNNHMVLHWVARDDIIAEFDFVGIPPNQHPIGPLNYPLHIDSTGYYNTPVAETGGGQSLLPNGFTLDTVYPNPFNGTARIEFTLPAPDRVAVSVVDVLGREVLRLSDRDYSAGKHALTFDGSDFASGVYFVRAGSRQYGTRVEKVVLLK
ncbi:T9SS type A sorting domain-containing protein [bacterium]|nr:T9SS type A sorting domain-containing protein [bacterium]